MTTATIPAPAPPLVEEPPAEWHRFTLDDYRRMGELGLLLPSDRVVLLDGLLVKKMTKETRHVTTTHQIFVTLLGLMPAGWFPRKEDPVEIRGGPRGDSAPEPDLAVIAGKNSDYKRRNPAPADVRLIVQVADTTLAFDRKGLARFARVGIPSAWIVNLVNETIEVYSEPSGDVAEPAYAKVEVKGVGEVVAITLDGTAVGPIRVEDLLA